MVSCVPFLVTKVVGPALVVGLKLGVGAAGSAWGPELLEYCMSSSVGRRVIGLGGEAFAARLSNSHKISLPSFARLGFMILATRKLPAYLFESFLSTKYVESKLINVSSWQHKKIFQNCSRFILQIVALNVLVRWEIGTRGLSQRDLTLFCRISAVEGAITCVKNCLRSPFPDQREAHTG